MRVSWNEDTIAWMCDASAYTGYHRKLASLLRPHLSLGGTLCDIGCGLGLADLELAPDLAHVTCLDHSAPALAFLEAQVRQLGITNLTTLHQDAFSLPDRQWDTVMSLFYGNAAALPHWLPHARDKLVMILFDEEKPSFGTSHPAKRHTAQRTVEQLERKQVRYRIQRAALEYGQPFRSMADAARFALLYGNGTDDGSLRARITETGRADLPYYVPNQKHFAIISISREENPC